MELRLTAASDWDGPISRLDGVTETSLRRDYGKAIRTATKPAPILVKSSTSEFLPDPGGYAAIIADAMEVKFKPFTGGVIITGSAMGKANPRKVRDLEDGRLRAPSFPRRRRGDWSWHRQAVKPGFFTKPITRLEPKIRDAITQAMGAIVDKIAGG